MIKKRFVFIMLLILIFSLSVVYAGNNTTVVDPLQPRTIDGSPNQVEASEDGHFNITFSDGYNGYCLEYGEKEATKGDKFYVVDTDYAVNNNNNEKIGNYLKTFFIDYYDVAMTDKVATQHYIWAFSDNFTGWRINQTLVDYIKAHPKDYPDEGVKKINNTTEMVYSFKVLLSEYLQYQNYFSYKIFFQNITQNNQTPLENDTNNDTLHINQSSDSGNASNDVQINKYNDTYTSHSNFLKHIREYTNHRTGNSLWIVICALVILCAVFIYRKYYN